ncbi:MAG: NUDIX hydrolase [Actinobacteria bacterium]|nr:NUDIX hydrolase [Actinomycetota bacterium]MBU4386513.1 NUDIX hydrolase [Actinomycetota bacterium]MCG2795188.1 NUDIX hydrolase [Actinomycetes bacterium]
MYIRIEDVKETERRLGSPVAVEMAFEIEPYEYDVVEGSMKGGRAHDVTMFIRDNDDRGLIAVIRKPFFPPGAFRAPSGAANRGETLEQGALRESLEETGLEVELTCYLARISARFTSGDKPDIDWTSHVFDARERAGEIGPIDTGEIAEARWTDIEELQGRIRQALLDANWGLFRYRVALTDLSVERMGRGT